MQAMKSLGMSDMQKSYAGQGPKITGYKEKVTQGRTTNIPGVALPR
jgi:hypothetical protein